MLNQHRRRQIGIYANKLLEPGRLGKMLRDPGVVARSIKTFAVNKNLRQVPADELLSDAEDAVHAMARLAPKNSEDVTAWLPVKVDANTTELGRLFKDHGSDKSTEHDYFEVYGSILSAKRERPIRVLEVGLGTNNLAFQSNMGLGGRPGASCRAFRDWAPKAEVIGADIDRGVLFTEDRIRTYFVDQTDPASLAGLAETAGTGFDLIIDDGLHLPHSNLNTIEALLPLLADDGVMVIEDIDAIHLHYWRATAGLLAGYDTCLCERRGGWLFLIRKAGDK